MAKIIVIGETPKKPMQFLKLVTADRLEPALATPKDYAFIELICLGYHKGFDLIFAYNKVDERKNGRLYLGFWNDGVTE